ncbi:MAG: phage replisome organizer N-terminal domain-containing protein [Clostridia bacterium]|nr:phage replisome organizer N-terminal domain-containing protein [Clostridia bacterium]
MATGKRYYWIKLRDTFMRSDAVDFLMGQKDGANYVVLYQMLCLMTINTDGRLSRTIGEIIIPYDVEKIQRDCKYFTIDTIRVALTLYQRLGLIYEDTDGTLVLVNHADMVGSETDYAQKNRKIRARQQQKRLESGHNVSSDVSQDVSENETTENRDKILDIRDNSGGGDNLDTNVKDNEVSTTTLNPYGDYDGPTPDFNTLEVYAANNLRSVTPYNLAELVSYREDKKQPLPEELIRYAIDLACGAGKPFYNYVHGILERMKAQDIRTIGDAKAAQAEHEKRKQQKQQQQEAKTTDAPETFGDFY